MASSSRTFIVANAALVTLIGGMVWFLFAKETAPVGPSAPETESVTKSAAKPSFTTESLSADDAQAIEVLQAQLDEEKQRADKARAQIQARARETVTPPVAEPASNQLEVEQQKQRISQMIAAQLEGAEAENRRLTQALAQKNQEIVSVKKQNSELARKLIKLDDSAQSLLAKLVADGKSISSSDQDYLGAMQALQDDTVSPQRSVDLSQTDLINRVEIADNSDTESIASQLRSAVNELMDDQSKDKPAVNSNKPANSGQATNLQNSINNLIARSEDQKSQRQFQADLAYLDSLTPMEKERLNETRWVTVRSGDTLYDISKRVYNDGWLYHKIFEANPQILSSPDNIKTGQRLRVPL